MWNVKTVQHLLITATITTPANKQTNKQITVHSNQQLPAAPSTQLQISSFTTSYIIPLTDTHKEESKREHLIKCTTHLT